MNDTGECTLEPADLLWHSNPMWAAFYKGMPIEGLLKPQLVRGLTYIMTRHHDDSIHIRWQPTKKPGTASP